LYAIEIKYPLPGKTFTTPVHYEIPRYYIPQILSEMKDLQVHQTIYVSYTAKSSTVFLIRHSEELWNLIWKEAATVLKTNAKKNP
jgi:hypothetical protein